MLALLPHLGLHAFMLWLNSWTDGVSTLPTQHPIMRMLHMVRTGRKHIRLLSNAIFAVNSVPLTLVQGFQPAIWHQLLRYIL